MTASVKAANAPTREEFSERLLNKKFALMALFARDRPGGSGVGQVVDVALYEAMWMYMESTLPEYEKLLAQIAATRTGLKQELYHALTATAWAAE